MGAAGRGVQIAATALLLRTMRERNFAVGVAYSKTEVVQVAVFSLVLLGDPLDRAHRARGRERERSASCCWRPPIRERPLRSLLDGFTSRSALLGIGSGAGMRVVGRRLPRRDAGRRHAVVRLLGGAFVLVVAQAMQTVMLGRLARARARPTSSRAR